MSDTYWAVKVTPKWGDEPYFADLTGIGTPVTTSREKAERDDMLLNRKRGKLLDHVESQDVVRVQIKEVEG